jgi:hypothetical protein
MTIVFDGITAGGGSGSSFTKTYWFNANDNATATTPITHTGSATGTYLTNNGLGSATTAYNPDSKAALWNPATNLFDFTSLKIGDTIEIRLDIIITNAAAQEINISISLAEGTAGARERNVVHDYYKTASTSEPITALYRLFIDDENMRTGGARFRFSSLDASSITVIGWAYQITEV